MARVERGRNAAEAMRPGARLRAGTGPGPLSRTAARVALAATLGLIGAAPLAVTGQVRMDLLPDSLVLPRHRVADVPYGPGEELRYKVKYGIFGIGQASLGVPRLDTIHGWSTYVAEMRIKASVLGYGLDQKFSSWIDTERLFSRRFVKDEPNRPREYDIFPEERRVHQIQDVDTTWTIPTSEPLDDLAFVYLARTLPLEVGQTYEYNRYFKEERNPIILKVLRRDKREVGAGVFNTIVVQPIIPRSSLFSEGGDVEVHFSDDERRLVVYMKVDGPVLPFNFTMHLEEFEESAAPVGGSDDSKSSTPHGPPDASRRDPPN